MADFDLAEAIVKFASCTETNWNNFNLPIPQNVVIVTLDTRKFKRGDGIHLYSDLPDGPSIEGIESGNESVVNSLTQLTAVNEDDIIVINNEIYSGSGTKLTTIMNRLGSIENKDVIQDANVVAIGNQFSMTTKGLVVGDNGKLAIISNKKIAPGVLPETIVVETPQSPLHLISFDIYSDRACTKKVEELYYRSTYYAYIEASHDSVDIDNMTYGLTCDLNNNITITQVERGLFKIDINKPVTILNVVFTIGLSYNADIIQLNKQYVLNPYEYTTLAIYGGTGGDRFTGVAVDPSGNIYAVGHTLSEGSGGTTYGDALIVKFDSSLNILARKVVGSTMNDGFNGAAVDSLGNVYAVGWNQVASPNGAIIVKFDSSLNILLSKRYGGTVEENFRAIVIDSSDNIYASGYGSSEGSGNVDAIIVKFNTSLNVIIKKRYYGTTGDEFFQKLSVDSSGNIYAVGYTTSEGSGGTTYGDALIVKFDSSLNILARKRYGGTGEDFFQDVVVDSSNNVYVVGSTTSEMTGTRYSFVIKFDSSLNILLKKTISSVVSNSIRRMCIYDNNIYCCGEYDNDDALIIKLDLNLNLIDSKLISGSGTDSLYDIDYYQDNIIIVGNTTSEGLGGSIYGDALIVKMPINIPNGVLSGTVLSGLSLNDASLNVIDSTLTLANSTLTLATSTLTTATPSLIVSNSTLTLEKDTF